MKNSLALLKWSLGKKNKLKVNLSHFYSKKHTGHRDKARKKLALDIWE